MRLDAIASAGFRMSRSKMMDLIKAGGLAGCGQCAWALSQLACCGACGAWPQSGTRWQRQTGMHAACGINVGVYCSWCQLVRAIFASRRFTSRHAFSGPLDATWRQALMMANSCCTRLPPPLLASWAPSRRCARQLAVGVQAQQRTQGGGCGQRGGQGAAGGDGGRGDQEGQAQRADGAVPVAPWQLPGAQPLIFPLVQRAHFIPLQLSQ